MGKQFRLAPAENQEDCNAFTVYKGREIVGYIESRGVHASHSDYRDLVVFDVGMKQLGRQSLTHGYEKYRRTATDEELDECCRLLRDWLRQQESPYIFYISDRG